MEELSGFYSVKMDTFLSDPASALSDTGLDVANPSALAGCAAADAL